MSYNITPIFRNPGRPRDGSIDDRVIKATLNLIVEIGYDAMSMANIAAEAKVTKPSLYRRWENKEDLVTSAVSTLAAKGPDHLADGVWEQLECELKSFHKAISRPGGMALIGNVLALEARHPQLVKLYREKVVNVRRSRLIRVLESGKASGALRPETDARSVVSMLLGFYYASRLEGTQHDETWPATCIKLIRRGIET
ncbi:TetR/AcrR family transcriptional regulator [Nesterenkonia muleiensis]|uniref:TetR/AcrR family transcriptional regulator n=1 Tax=Nesterenkonia muleiensis TaxID=2282648 RepID=UPI000E763B52|nr:TetR/AcrR family transcriptional regulator [Nesterenkonia muleiensis]